MTETALFHIAPATIFPKKSIYALAENLYHESIHQELSFKLLSSDIFIEDFEPATSVKIEIPWRKTVWEVDRVLHAAYVYWRLIPMRSSKKLKALVSEEELNLISIAVQKGIENFNYLSSKLKEVDFLFTEEGKNFLGQMCL